MIRLNPHVLDVAREKKGLTSDEKLATELDVTGSTVRNWRSGRANPDLANFAKLSKASGIPMSQMLIRASDAAAEAAA